MFYQFEHMGSPDYLKIERGKNFSFPQHIHPCFEIITILSGEMNITIDTVTFNLKQNESALIFPNQIHSLVSSKSEHVLCIFSPNIVPAFATKYKDKIPETNKFILDKYLIEQYSSLNADSPSYEKKACFYSICGQFNQNIKYKKSESDVKNILHKCFLFVEKHFSDNCTLESLSKETGYEYSYLSRLFKNKVGSSFNTYVKEYRLGHACYLMNDTSLSVVDIAYECGFTSLRSFNKNFKDATGCTPTQYRKNFKQSVD